MSAEPSESPAGAGPTAASWTTTLNVWIARFRAAQTRARDLQGELDKVQRGQEVLLRRYEDALSRMTDEALAEHREAVSSLPSEPPAPRRADLEVETEVHSGSCGCA